MVRKSALEPSTGASRSSAPARPRRTDHQRRDAFDFRNAQDSLGVAESEIARGFAAQEAGRDAAGFRPTRYDDHQARAERLKFPRDIAPRTLAQRRQRDHGRDADAHRQQQHRAAHPRTQRGVAGHTQEVGKFHY